MKKFAIVNNFIGTRYFTDDINDFKSQLVAELHGCPKIVRLDVESMLALNVFVIEDVVRDVESFSHDDKD